MAALPSYVCVLFNGYGESFDPSVERTEMERGPPMERVLNSQVLMQIDAVLLFESLADAAAFEDWYFTTIKRIGYFTMTHPRTLQTITAKFRGGDIGTLVPTSPTFKRSKRNVTFEYLR